jgi:hypothetical protein
MRKVAAGNPALRNLRNSALSGIVPSGMGALGKYLSKLPQVQYIRQNSGLSQNPQDAYKNTQIRRNRGYAVQPTEQFYLPPAGYSEYATHANKYMKPQPGETRAQFANRRNMAVQRADSIR